MKKRHVQKMLTMALTAAVICSSVPVSAETVSENETAVTVDTAAEQEIQENWQKPFVRHCPHWIVSTAARLMLQQIPQM